MLLLEVIPCSRNKTDALCNEFRNTSELEISIDVEVDLPTNTNLGRHQNLLHEKKLSLDGQWMQEFEKSF